MMSNPFLSLVPEQTFDPVVMLFNQLSEALKEKTFDGLPNVRCVVKDHPVGLNLGLGSTIDRMAIKCISLHVQVMDLFKSATVFEHEVLALEELSCTPRYVVYSSHGKAGRAPRWQGTSLAEMQAAMALIAQKDHVKAFEFINTLAKTWVPSL